MAGPNDAASAHHAAGSVLYAPRRVVATRASFAARVMAMGVAATSLTLLVLAAGLTPSPSGVGSHTGLGLNSCALLDRTGLPCPGCGMTTSFTWFARGHLPASLYVQPMGMALALIAACCVWGGTYVALTGRPLYRLIDVLPVRNLVVGMVGLTIAAWGWKMFIRLRGLDGWG